MRFDTIGRVVGIGSIGSGNIQGVDEQTRLISLSYAIHTRESQLDRYDYSKVIDVTKNGDDFIVTILTVFDKLIKVVI